MPELPDVDIRRQYLNATALHQAVQNVHVDSPSILEDTSAQAIGRVLKHKTFRSTQRHGKYLFIAVDDGHWLVMHFGMTGELKYLRNGEDTPDYTRMMIEFENGARLAYIAPRKLGRIALTDSPFTYIQAHKLGADARKITEQQFIELTRQHRGTIKSWLTNQQLIAGIGNVYADEILFQARIHPNQAVDRLDDSNLKHLYKAMHKVLDSAIRAHADPNKMPDNFLLPHRGRNEQCPRCHQKLENTHTSGRTTWFCPHCQKKD